MYLDDIGEIIAVRELHIEEGASFKKGEVRIGKPRPNPDTESYYCPFQIVGIGGEEIRYAAGIDAVQSLQLVMIMIGATLKYLNVQQGGKLGWKGGSNGDFGFPSAE